MNAFLFNIAFYLAAPFWALIIFAPGWTWTKRIISSPLIVLPVLAVYLVLVIPRFGDFWSVMTRPQLGSVQALAGSASGAAAIWSQVIAWDLLIGRWMYLDSRRCGVHPLVMAPIMVLTILLSPFGYLVYLGVRAVTSSATESRVELAARSSGAS